MVVQRPHNFLNRTQPFFQAFGYLCFAHPSMIFIGTSEAFCVCDFWAMSWPINFLFSWYAHVQALKVVPHTAIRGRHDSCVPPHYMISSKESIFFLKSKTHMVRHVARGCDGFDGPFITGNLGSITQHMIGTEVPINRLRCLLLTLYFFGVCTPRLRGITQGFSTKLHFMRNISEMLKIDRLIE